MTHLAPLPWRGFCLLWPRALCNHAVGLLAAFSERCNSLCEGHPSWQATLPPSVGCPAVTQRGPLVRGRGGGGIRNSNGTPRSMTPAAATRLPSVNTGRRR
jgi:hypothetical protein